MISTEYFFKENILIKNGIDISTFIKEFEKQKEGSLCGSVIWKKVILF